MKGNRYVVLFLAALVVAPCLARCSSCSRRSVTDDSGRNTMHVSCKVGENKTPAKRIGVKQSFDGVVEKVSDGDTIWVKVEGQHRSVGDKRGKVKVRLDRIDAPESDQAYGKAAKEALAKKIAGKQVRIEWKKRDKYDRVLGVVYVGDEDVNLWMVREGNAWHYSQFDKTPEYAKAHEAARKAKRGLWSEQGAINPQEWRKAKKGKRGLK